MEPSTQKESSESDALITAVKDVYSAVLKYIGRRKKVVDFEQSDELESMNTQLSETDELSGIENRSLISRAYMDICKNEAKVDIFVDAGRFDTHRFAQTKFSYMPVGSDEPVITDTFDEKTTTVTIMLNLSRILKVVGVGDHINNSNIFEYLTDTDYVSILQSAILAGSFIMVKEGFKQKSPETEMS